MSLSISIVIPCRNHRTELTACIESLREADRTDVQALEIIVVDDGSDPVLSVEESIRLIRHNVARGVGASRNGGASAARHELVMFVDSDVKVARDYFSELHDLMVRYPQANIYQGPYLPVPANQRFSSYEWYLALSRSHVFAVNVDGEVGHFLNSACFVIRRDFFLRIGGFSEVFSGSGGEEFEFLKRLGDEPILQDSRLGSFHHSEPLVARLRKLYRRSQNYPSVLAANRAVKTRFKIYRCLEMACVAGLSVALLLLVQSSVESAWFALFFLVGIAFANLPLTRYIYESGSFRLMLLSIAYRYVEFGVIMIGMAVGLIKGARRLILNSFARLDFTAFV